MATGWFKNGGLFGRSYDFTRLIDTRVFNRDKPAAPRQIICDIDKTYLETNFESLLQMVRIALEEAHQKVTVRGASEVLLAARWGGKADPLDRAMYPRPLHFVSASPPQMRAVLEEKLALDGLDWDSDTFKNQAYNLRKGRMDLLRQHIAYKSAAIFNIMKRAAANTEFFLIGDNAEHDALVYTGIDLFLQRRLSVKGYLQFLELVGVEPKVAQDFIKQLDWEPHLKVAGILIRKAPGYEVTAAPPLSDPIFQFNNFFEASLYFVSRGMISIHNLWPLARAFHNRHGFKRRDLAQALLLLADSVSDVRQLDEIDRLCKKLLVDPSEVAQDSENLFKARDLTAYQALGEEDILRAADLWRREIEK